eukprot:3937345-Rhodomonas_salina.1
MGTPGHITASYVRQRRTLDTLMGNMQGFEFRHSFRMDIHSMKALYAVIADRLHKDEEMAILSCGSGIDPRVKMAMAL